MKKILSIIIITSCCCLQLMGQPYFNEIYRSDTGTATTFRSVVVRDTAIYVTGITSASEPTPHNAGFFARLSLDGTPEAFRIYSDTLHSMSMWNDGLIATNDGHLASIANQRNDYRNACLAVFDANGDTLMYKVYGYQGTPTTSYTLNQATQIRQDPNNNYYILSGHGVLYKPDSINFVVMKIDSVGNETKRIFFPPSPDPYAPHKESSDLQLLPNGHFIISATIHGPCPLYYSQLPTDSCRHRTWIFEADTSGQVLWQYLSPIDRHIEAPKITLTRDGGIVFSGKEILLVPSNSYIGYRDRQHIGKIDSNHVLVWEYTSPDGRGYFSRSVELADGSILACGSKYQRYHYENQDTSRFWGYLVKFSTTGDSIGAQAYHRLSDCDHPYPQYDYAEHYFQDMTILPDSSLLMVGEIIDLYIPSPTAGYWAWVVHTDPYGCVEQQTCFPLSIPKPPVSAEGAAVQLHVYPNPANDYVTFAYKLPFWAAGSAVLLVSDAAGRPVVRLPLSPSGDSGEQLCDTRAMPAGIYYYTLLFGTEQLASGSLSVVHK